MARAHNRRLRQRAPWYREPWIRLNYHKAEMVRKLRNERGWTLKRIAERYDISVPHVCNVAKGRHWVA